MRYHKSMKLLWLIIASIAVSCSCSKESNLYKEEILEMARQGDPNLEVLVPPSMTIPLVNCGEYLPPCRTGYKVKIFGMEVTGLYYEDQDKAFKSAKSMRGYHLRNWAFDQVSGEPILERFFEKHLNAKKVE